MGAPLVFEVWADDGPPRPPPAPVTTSPRVHGAQAGKVLLALLLGAAAAAGTLTAVDRVVARPPAVETPQDAADLVPHRLGRGDLCGPGPRC
ncbi:hypothetical protein ACFQ8T_11480 [Isoptericola sp. NPDC056618]|uniref:hypothetical protein n=1 Tax=Isoptericola sp. NPDC056618 TaxID=3345878 RepID=UPI00367CAEE3